MLTILLQQEQTEVWIMQLRRVPVHVHSLYRMYRCRNDDNRNIVVRQRATP